MCCHQFFSMCDSSGKIGTVRTLEVLFPSFPLHSFPLPSHFFPSFLLSSSPPLYGGSNFNDFPKNQLIIDFAFLCKPAWGNATISPFPLVLISFGETAFPIKYLGERRSPRVPPRLHHCVTVIKPVQVSRSQVHHMLTRSQKLTQH